MARESQRPDGENVEDGILKVARDKFHEWHDVHAQLDELLYGSAKEVGGVALESIFDPVPEEFLKKLPRPDAINHNLTYLRSNAFSAADTERSLSLLEILHGQHAEANIESFRRLNKTVEFFERLKNGQTFILVGSHLEFQDVGFNLGYLTRVAHEEGIDRFDAHVTAVIGRMLGFLDVLGMNVIDDILRPASNIGFSLPVSGGEAINEGDITDQDLNHRLRRFRANQNARLRQQFMELVHSSSGHVIIEAGSGSRDAIDDDGFTVMEPFAQGTREDLYRAVKAGAVVIPIFGDYGDTVQPSVVEFGPEVDDLDSPEDAHRVGEIIAAIGNRARGAAIEKNPDIERFKSPIRYGSH